MNWEVMKHVCVGISATMIGVSVTFYLALTSPSNNSHGWEPERRWFAAISLTFWLFFGGWCIGMLSWSLTNLWRSIVKEVKTKNIEKIK